MHPYLFELLGIHLQGVRFELVFWTLVVGVGALLALRERKAGSAGVDALIGYAIATALAGFGAYRWVKVVTGGADGLFFDSAGFQLPTYGVMLATGFSTSLWLAWRDARRTPDGLSGAELLDLGFWVLIAGLLGSHLLYVVTTGDISSIFQFWKGGLVFYGGPIGAAIAGWFWTRRHGHSFLRALDALVPYVALGHFFGRLGCLGAGCCWGGVCDVPWAIQYPGGSPAYRQHLESTTGHTHELLIQTQQSLPVHPAPLYEAAAELAIFAFLLLWLRQRKRFHGQLALTWVLMYSAVRFITELFRGDSIRGFVFELPLPAVNELLGLPADTITLLSTSQTISLVLAIGALATVLWGRHRAAAERPASPTGDA